VLGGVGLCVLGGIALMLALPRYGGLWPLALVALVPMLFAQYRLFPRKLSGLAPGLTVGVYWLGGLYQLNTIAPLWMLAIAGIVIGLVWGLIFSLGRAFNERTSFALFMIELPALWVAIDLVPWGGNISGSALWLGYNMADVPALIQPVSVVSTPGLSFLILAINGALGLVLLAIYDRRQGTPTALAVPARVATVTLAVVCAVSLVWLGVSAILYSQELGKPQVRVAVAQIGTVNSPGVLGSIEFTPALAGQFTQMTKQAAAQGAQYVLWPEDILNFDPTDPAKPFVADLAKQTKVYILTGFTTDGGRTINRLALFGPDGRVVATFQKNHPVILMGEYWDYPPTFPAWPTQFATVGPLVCFDIGFPFDTAQEVLNGAQIIMVPSGGPASTASDQYRQAQFRAVENRVAYVKGDWAWDSAIIEPNGTLVSHTETTDEAGEEFLVVGNVHLGTGEGTFFTHYRYLFPIIVFLAVLIRMVIQVGTSPIVRRRRRPGELASVSDPPNTVVP